MVYNEKLGEKIRMFREKHAITTDELAARAGIDAKLIEKIEKGELVPYLSPLIKLSRALGVRLGTFLDDQASEGPVVSKAGDMAESKRVRGIDNDTDADRTFYSLAVNKASRHMEPLIVELTYSEGEKTPLSSHEGEEFVYVLEGKIEVIYGKETHLLEAGESIYYDSVVEHDVRAAGVNAKILAVIHEPS